MSLITKVLLKMITTDVSIAEANFHSISCKLQKNLRSDMIVDGTNIDELGRLPSGSIGTA